MLEFGGNFIWRHCLLHLNRFNFIYQLLPFVPLWYSRWCALGNDNDLTNLTLLPSFFFWAERATQSSKGSNASGRLRGTVLLSGNIFVSLSTQVPLGLTTRLREPNALAVQLGVDTWNIITAKLTSTVSYMIALSHKRAPTPYFWCNFLYRVKVYSNEFPPWSELCVAFEKHSLKHYASGGGTEIRLGGGGWRDRLQSSRLSAQSVRMQRSKIGGLKPP